MCEDQRGSAEIKTMCLIVGSCSREMFWLVGVLLGFGCFIFEIRSHVAHADLSEAEAKPWSYCICPTNAELVGVFHHTWPFLSFYWEMIFKPILGA